MESSFKDFLYEEYGEELAEKLIEVGVDNLFKLKTLDHVDAFGDNLIKVSYINHSEKFNFEQYDQELWDANLAQQNNLKRVGYSDSEIDKIFKKKFFI